MQLDPRRLVVLRAVHLHGGVAGAALAMHVTPSAISQQLAMLERESGVAIVDRSRRGGQRPLKLTPAGRRLVAHADRLARVLDEAEADIALVTGSVEGPVVVAAFFSVLRGFAGQALAQVAVSHPGIDLRVAEVEETRSAAAVRDRTVDVAVVEDDAARPRVVPRGLHYEPLADDPFVVVVPAQWPPFEDLADVATLPWVDGPPGTALGQVMHRVRSTTRLSLPAPHSVREFTAAVAVAAAGLAGSFVPELAMAAVTPPQQVRVQRLPGLGARRLGVVYRRSRHEPGPPVQVLLEALRESAAKHHSRA